MCVERDNIELECLFRIIYISPNLMLHITAVKYIADYKISVAFDDGSCGVADFESVVKNDHRSIIRQLANLDEFKNFKVQANTIVWANGVDFAPEFIKSLI